MIENVNNVELTPAEQRQLDILAATPPSQFIIGLVLRNFSIQEMNNALWHTCALAIKLYPDKVQAGAVHGTTIPSNDNPLFMHITALVLLLEEIDPR